MLYDGGDLPGQQPTAVSTIQMCADICLADSSCLFWSFDRYNRRCLLKNSDSGRRADQAFHSGQRGCGKTP